MGTIYIEVHDSLSGQLNIKESILFQQLKIIKRKNNLNHKVFSNFFFFFFFQEHFHHNQYLPFDADDDDFFFLLFGTSINGAPRSSLFDVLLLLEVPEEGQHDPRTSSHTNPLANTQYCKMQPTIVPTIIPAKYTYTSQKFGGRW